MIRKAAKLKHQPKHNDPRTNRWGLLGSPKTEAAGFVTALVQVRSSGKKIKKSLSQFRTVNGLFGCRNVRTPWKSTASPLPLTP
jgi:hypothetical protein